ncbi:ABC transporter permease [Streptomyces sp. INA 01156]
MSEPWLPRPDGLPAQLYLLAQDGLADHSRLREGRLPKVPDTVTAATTRIEGAVTTDTAGDLNIEVGSVLTFPGVARAPLEVRITGIVAPRDPEGAYWSTDPDAHPGPDDPPRRPDVRQYWMGALLLPPDAAPALLSTAGKPVRYWGSPVRPDLHGYDMPRLTSAVAAVESGPVLQRMREATALDLRAHSELDDVLTGHAGLRAAIGPLVSVAAFGTGTVAAVVLLMAGGLAADRRGGELTLLRARGGSLPGVTGRLLAETAVVAVPAAALGLAAAWLTVREARPVYSVAAAGAVTLLACLALPCGPSSRTAPSARTPGAGTSPRPAPHRAARSPNSPCSPWRWARSWRCAPAARRAGRTPPGRPGVPGPGAGGRDRRAGAGTAVPAAPARAGPPGGTAAGRGRPAGPGPRGPCRRFRGAAPAGPAHRADHGRLRWFRDRRRGRRPGPGGPAHGRRRRPRERAPRPARRPARPGPPGTRRPGGHHRQRRRPRSVPEDTVPVAGVDPAGDAALTRHTGIGAFDRNVLAPAGRTPCPPWPPPGSPTATAPGPSRCAWRTAARSPCGSCGCGSGPGRRRRGVPGGGPVRALGPRRPPDRAAGDRRPGGRGRAAPGGGRWRDVGPGARRGTRRIRRLAPPVRRRTRLHRGGGGGRRVRRARPAADPGAGRPERAALLARLRTMGLTRAQGRRLLVLESLPQALLAAAGGTLTAWATIRLLAPGIDLTAVALPATRSPAGRATLLTDPVSLLVPALAVVVLTVGIAAVQAWWTGRRDAVRELRAGDAR